MGKKHFDKNVVIWLLAILGLVFLYVNSYLCLNTDLKSIFDEGLFVLSYKADNVFTVITHPLSLDGELGKAIFPGADEWDVLTHRQVAFGIKMLGLVVLFIASYIFFKKKTSISFSHVLSLMACLLLMGFQDICGKEIGNGNQDVMFLQMIILSLSLLAVSVTRRGLKILLVILAGFACFCLTLCNPSGGGLVFVLSALFLFSYGGFSWKETLADIVWLALGSGLALLVMHVTVISIHDCWTFINNAIFQTTEGATHHSLKGVLLSIPFAIRDLVMTVTCLLGVTYVFRLIKNNTTKKWFAILVGILLFMILYKWQVKPAIGFVSIMTWVSFMVWESRGIEKRPFHNDDFVLFLYLYFMPMGLAFGTNIGILNRATTFIIPWGLLVYLIGELIKKKSLRLSQLYFVFVFALVLYGMSNKVIQTNKWDAYTFEKEKPIARMHLTKAQSDYYHEVYDILAEYGFVSREDTLLGFCFNEMTIVAMDALPYSNDQLPEEFLLHDKEKLVRPAFVILSEWDEVVLKDFLGSLDWNYPDAYDVFQLKNNPDPHSGYQMMQSSLYCLKNRKIQ